MKAQDTRSYRNGSRMCIHFINGRVNVFKICPFSYECYHCGFDQWLDHMEREMSPVFNSKMEEISCFPGSS